VGYLNTMYGMVKKCKPMAKMTVEEGEREREKQMGRERRGGISTGIGGRSVGGPRGDGGISLAAMWKERGSRMALIIPSQFIKMKVRFLLTATLTYVSDCDRVPGCRYVLRSLDIRRSRLQHASWLRFVLHPHPNCVR